MFDLEYIKQDQYFLAGCDEVGRGPLAGPVVAGCVFLDLEKKVEINKVLQSLMLLGVTDSKGLSEKKRELIIEKMGLTKLEAGKNCVFDSLQFNSLSFRIEEVSTLEIEQINILHASLLGMKRAYLGLLDTREHSSGTLLIDGNKKLEGQLGIPIIKGDAKSLLIGLASILAKVYRDRLMKEMGLIYTEYGFEQNAGYPTEKHRKALKDFGPCPIHRKTFKGVKEFL